MLEWMCKESLLRSIRTKKNSFRIEVVELKWHLNILLLNLKEHINRNSVFQVSF